MFSLMFFLAVVIIVVLAIVAYRLQSKVKKVEASQQQQLRQYEEQKQEKRDSMNKSIQILAQGVVADQLTLTEGAIRISVLLEFLGVSSEQKESYSAFYQLAEATAHIPILEKWKSLPTKEKLQYDNERLRLEQQYGDFVMNAAKRILGQSF